MKQITALLLVLPIFATAWPSLLLAQVRAERSPVPRSLDGRKLAAGADVETRLSVLAGHVLTPEGLPAVGALVTSSAGGRTHVREDGSFRLEVELPRDAQDVELKVLASSPMRMFASVSVSIDRPGGTNPAGTLALAGAVGCADWVPTFGGVTSVSTTAHALTVFDDGSGPALFMAGQLSTVGDTNARDVAKWNGSTWQPLGTGMDGPSNPSTLVWALAVFDDGSGPALYAAGNFTSAGGVPAVDIARWNGNTWSALGSGTNGEISALAVFDDGSGPALYAGGDFTSVGGVPAADIAKWNGSAWSALGSGMDGTVWALAVFDDGSGPALYAGGRFTHAGGLPAVSIAKWNGVTWSMLGSGIEMEREGERTPGLVNELVVFDGGGGAALYVGGDFTHAGGVHAHDLAKLVARASGGKPLPVAATLGGGTTRWRSAWSLVDESHYSTVTALEVFDDGSGPALYANRRTQVFLDGQSDLWRANGSVWSLLEGLTTEFRAMHGFDDGDGPKLYVAGSIVKRWNGTSLEYLSAAIERPVAALAYFDDPLGGGPSLYAGWGSGLESFGVGKWTGTRWSFLEGSFLEVFSLCVFDSGAGAELVASVKNQAGQHELIRWDGVAWSDPTPTNGPVRATIVFDDGSGPALYAGGSFTTIDGFAANRIAKWDGASWTSLGSGMNNAVHALTIFDDGMGPALYAGGTFTSAGGVSANRVAKWDGASWAAMSLGANGPVHALAAFDGGSGPALYAGGTFTSVGPSVSASRIARWDGQGWAALGSGLADHSNSAEVRAFTVLDDGNGPSLFVGGGFLTAGGMQRPCIARWNGSSWFPLGQAMSSATSTVMAFAVTYEEGQGPALVAGGDFTSIDSGDLNLARWQGCDDTAPSISHPSEVLVEASLSGQAGRIVTFSVTVSDSQDPAPALVCVPPSGSLFSPGTSLVTCTATDGAGNQTVRQFPVHVVPRTSQNRRE